MIQILLAFLTLLSFLALATSGRSTTTDSNILQYVLGKAAYTAPPGCYFSLLSTTPTADNGSFVELAAIDSYARAGMTNAATNGAADWSATTTDATGVWKTNAVAITFPVVTTLAWLTATGFGIHSASAVGVYTDILYWGTFGSGTTVGIGAQASFAIGALKVTEA